MFREQTLKVPCPSGLRRSTQARLSSDAQVRTLLAPNASLAQLAEHWILNPRVAGSSPAGGLLETQTAISKLSYFENKPNVFRKKKLLGTMAEWSKAVDLSSTIFGCAGSNPAGTKY